MSRIASRLKPHALLAPSTPASYSMSRCAQLQPIAGGEGHANRRSYQYSAARRPTLAKKQAKSVEDAFVQALVTASSCSRHQNQSRSLSRQASQGSSNLSPHRSRSRGFQHCSFSSQTSKRQTALAPLDARSPKKPKRSKAPDISRSEYKDLVHDYSEDEFKFRPKFTKDKVKAGEEVSKPAKTEHFPLAPRLVLTAEQEMLPAQQSQRQTLEPEDEEHAADVNAMKELLDRRVGSVPHKKLWKAWEKLRNPRPRYLADTSISLFFRHLSWVEFRSSRQAMERYFALMEECINEGVELDNGAWTSAITYAGKCVRNVTSTEVKAAIETWMRMEQAGHRANHYTFHILVEVAILAGRFALADTLFDEMRARNMPFNRHFRVTIIYYAGVRRDSKAVRQAFQELVDADELVDTLVMNVVITSLLKAGELPAAESTFLRMKALHEDKFGSLPPSHWRDRRRLDKILNKSGATLRREKQQHQNSFFGAPFSMQDRKEEVQRTTPIAPDAETYRILIKHHAHVTGDFPRVRELLDEAKSNGQHIHGSTYFNVLRGFVSHGGYGFSAWNPRSLEEVWKETLGACSVPNSVSESATALGDESYDMMGAMMSDQMQLEIDKRSGEDTDETPEMQRPVYFTKSVAYVALHAFYKCMGPKRVLQTWNEILEKWVDASDDDKRQVQKVVDRMMDANGMYRV